MGTYSQLLQNKKPPASPAVEVYPARPEPSEPVQETGNNMASNIAIQQASNIAVLQFSEADIAALQESTYKPQTFRFSEEEIEWLKDTAYQLSKASKRGRVNQVDILRVSLLLFRNLLATDKTGLLAVIEKMK